MTGGASKTSFFNYFYIIHNINLLWKRDVRNILFKFFELQSKDFAVKYYLTNAANRIVKDLVAAVSEKGAGSGIDEYDDPAGKSTEQKGTTILFDSNMAKRLLKQLIAEREDNFYVSNESEFDEEAEEATQLYGRDRFLIQNRTYIPSSERSSPDYVPPGFFADSQYLIVLVKPQINLESDADGDQKVQPQAVVVAAEEMEFQKINIADQLAFSNLMGDTDGDEAVAKTRQILNIRSAQFYVARKSDVEKAVESDLDSILISNKAAEKGSVKEAPWPLWVPAECLIEHDYPLQTGHLQKVMEKTEANLVRDLANPIYVSSQASNNADGGPQEEEDHRTVVRSKHINERAHVIYVNFPTFEITANSLQHSIFFNVVINLLVYNDPARGERNDRLRKMTLALEQMEDIYAVIESVNTLQDKIRQTESLLAYQMQNSRKTATPTGFKSQLTDIRQAGIRYKDELYVLMEALKQLLNLSRTKNSVEVAWQLNVQAGKLVWTMMLDDGEPVCRWEFDKSSYEYIHNEDQSSANTLEIDKLHVENLLPPPQLYKDLINAYIADKRIVDFKKQKMLRVYWREQAPVAGIAVVNHFEIKLFPLQFQMNYEIGKLLAYYIFPEKKKKVESTGSSSGSAVGGKASTDDAKSSGKGSSLASDASYTSSSTAATSAANTIGLKGKKAYAPSESQDDALVQMQTRASKNKTFIYVKVPGVPLCLSYRVSMKERRDNCILMDDLFLVL